jgi:hypothetical protein
MTNCLGEIQVYFLIRTNLDKSLLTSHPNSVFLHPFSLRTRRLNKNKEYNIKKSKQSIIFLWNTKIKRKYFVNTRT